MFKIIKLSIKQSKRSLRLLMLFILLEEKFSQSYIIEFNQLHLSNSIIKVLVGNFLFQHSSIDISFIVSWLVSWFFF